MFGLISVFNEEEFAKKMIKNGFLSKRIRFELKILAKYYFFLEKIDIKQIKPILIAFCEKNMPGFNMYIHYDVINKTVSYLRTKSCKYIVIESIFISDEFVQYFNHLDFNEDIKKFLFTLGILGKINGLTGGSDSFVTSYKKHTDIKKIAGIKTKWDITTIRRDLEAKGIARPASGNSFELLFLDNIPFGEPIYKITDFYNLGDWFDFYNRVKGFCRCEKCGMIFKKRTSKPSSQKYCNSCVGLNIKGERVKKIESKSFFCTMCGKPVFDGAKGKKQLCDGCYLEYRKKNLSESYQKRRKINQE